MIRKMIRKMMRKMTNNRGFQELGETGQGVSRGTSEILVKKMSKSEEERESQRQRRRQPTPLPREERSEVKRIRSRSRDFLKAEESDDAFHNLQKSRSV